MAAVGQHAVTVTPAAGGGAVTISALVEQVSIHHGRDDDLGQPEADGATLDVFALAPAVFPPELDIGAVLRVTTTTPNGTWDRFAGRVTDLHLGWQEEGEETPAHGAGQVVAVGFLADTGRSVVGDVPFPQELDGARVARVMQLAGVTLNPASSDPGTVQILARDIDSQPALNVAHDAADSAQGLVWATRAGEIRYSDAQHRRGIQPSLALDAGDILVTPTWRRSTDGLVNSVSIGYGTTPSGGEQPRYVASDANSIAKWKSYGASITTALAALADAQALGNVLLVRNSQPIWLMAALPVAITELDQTKYEQLLGLDTHSLLTLTGLPAISNAPTSASLWVEGWRETLGYGIHEIELAVSGYCRTAPIPRWDDVDPAWLWGGEQWAELRRNRVRNPALSVDLTDWSFGAGPSGVATVSRGTDAALAVPGRTIATYIRGIFTTPPSAHVSTGPIVGGPTIDGVPVTAGVPVVLSGYVRTNRADKGALMIATVHDAAGATVGSFNGPTIATLAANTWTRLTNALTPPAGAVRAYIRFYVTAAGTNWVAGDWMDATAAMDDVALGDYFDGDSPDYPGADFAWTGEPGASPSTLTGRKELARNVMANPSAEGTYGQSGWLSNNGALYPTSYDTSVFHSGTRSVKSSPVGAQVGVSGGAFQSMYDVGGTRCAVVPGTAYAVSLWMRHNVPAPGSGRITVGYYWLDAAGAQVGATTWALALAPAADTWTRLTMTTVPAPANAATIRIMNSASRPSGQLTAAADTAWADDCAVTTGALVDYFDGATPDAPGVSYDWMGVANQSPSVATELATIPGGVDPSLTWDGTSCLGPPANLGRWNDQPASLRWDQVPAATVWNNYGG